MLRDLALEAFEEVGEAESLKAVDAIADVKTLGQVAKSATRETTALRALARITEPHALGSVARHAAVEAVRIRAFEAVRDAGAHDELLGVAMNSDYKDTALASLDHITDRTELDQVIARGRNKSAVKRAKSILREADEQAAHEAAAAAAAAAIVLPVDLPAVAEADAPTSPQGDPLGSVALHHAEPTASAPTASPDLTEVPAPVAAEPVVNEAEAQAAREQDLARRTARLTELAGEAEAAAADENFQAARKQFGIVRREWNDVSAGVEMDADVLAWRRVMRRRAKPMPARGAKHWHGCTTCLAVSSRRRRARSSRSRLPTARCATSRARSGRCRRCRASRTSTT
jgi:hypothetical protein